MEARGAAGRAPAGPEGSGSWLSALAAHRHHLGASTTATTGLLAPRVLGLGWKVFQDPQVILRCCKFRGTRAPSGMAESLVKPARVFGRCGVGVGVGRESTRKQYGQPCLSHQLGEPCRCSWILSLPICRPPSGWCTPAPGSPGEDVASSGVPQRRGPACRWGRVGMQAGCL